MTVDPIRPDLWQITLVAAKAARAKGLEHVAGGGYVSKIDLPIYTTNEHGWSTTTKRDLIGREGSPPNWNYMFGPESGAFAAISWNDVPELAAGAEEVSNIAARDENFERRISLLAEASSDQTERRAQIEFEYVRFVGDLIDRAEAIGATTDEELFDIYASLERARFAEVLSGDLMVPIALTAFDLPETLDVADGVRIEPLDEATQRARAESSTYGGRVSAYVVAAATHAIVIRDLAISNIDWRLRILRHFELDLTKVDQVIQ